MKEKRKAKKKRNWNTVYDVAAFFLISAGFVAFVYGIAISVASVWGYFHP